MNPKTVTVKVVEQERYYIGPVVLDGPLDKVIESLQRVREDIPEAHRASAYFELSGSDIDLEIRYERPETPDDVAARETASRECSRAEVERAERALQLAKQRYKQWSGQ